MRILFILFSFAVVCTSFAQKFAGVLIQNGKKYYQHTVSEGNTLFGLQQMYGCPVEEILNVNQGIERGLSEGQLIQIPVMEKTLFHNVVKKETLFSIARLYYVSVDSLIAHNAGVETGIKAGQTLKVQNATPRIQIDLPAVSIEQSQRSVPSPSDSVREKFKVSFHDSIVTHVVLKNETIYMLSKRFMVPVEELMNFNKLKNTTLSPGQLLQIRVKKENVNAVAVRAVPDPIVIPKDSLPTFQKKDFYTIGLFLPFNLDSTATLNKGLSSAAWEYYMGVKLALDSLAKSGLKADFYVYDYQSKNESIDQQLGKSEMKKMDLIYAPFQPKEAGRVADWAKANQVRTVFPVSVPDEFLKGNKFAFALTPSVESMSTNLANYIYQKHTDQQIILIKSEKQEDQRFYDSFLTAFRKLPIKDSRPRVIEVTWNDYRKFEKLNQGIFYVFLSTEKEKIISLLSYSSDKKNIEVFGLREWVDLKEVNSDLKKKFTFCYSSPTYFSLSENTLKPFHKKIRSKYGSDLTKMNCLGFDATMNICSQFLLSKKSPTGQISKYDFKQVGVGNGFQNTASFILKFQDFESIRLE
jgi:LysM repeat protein